MTPQKYARLIQTIFLLMIAFVTGCSMKNNHSTSLDGLQKFISLPEGTEAASFEMVTLPESNSEGIPGPTDYSALVGTIHFKDKRSLDVAIEKLSPLNPTAFPRNFIRPWMNKGEQKGFYAMLSGEHADLLSMQPWSRQKSLYAALTKQSDVDVLIFICYIEP